MWDIPTEPAYTHEFRDLPIITCEANATATETVILMHPEAGTTRILDEGSCITIEAQTESDFVRAASRLGFTLVGVMKPTS